MKSRVSGWGWRAFARAAAVGICALFCLVFVGSWRDTGAPLRRAGKGSAQARPVALALPASRPPGQARLSVRAVDEDAVALGGVRLSVLLLWENQAYLAGAATTDAEGRALLQELPAGEMFVLAEAEGRSRTSSRFVLDERDQREITLRLQAAASLALTVADDQGAPIARAWVEVTSGDPLPFVAEADPDGRAEVKRLGPPPYRVRVGAAGHESISEWVRRPGEQPLRFTLRPLGAIDVVVVDPQGSPAPAANVSIVGSTLWPARVVTADSVGRAHLPDLRAGVYNLRAALGTQVAVSELGVRLDRGQTRSLTLILAPGRRVSVHVTEAESEPARPLAAARVVLTEGGLSPFPIEATTDKRGVAELGPIALDGDGYVAVRADGFVPKSGIAVPSDAHATVDVPLVRGATLRGDVVDARGFPVAGATIEVVGTGPAGEPIDETPEHIAFREAHFTWALPGPRPLWRSGELGFMPGPIPPIPRAGPGGLNPMASAALPSEGRAATLRTATVRAQPPTEPWVTRSDGTFRAWPIPPGRVRAIVRHPAYVESSSSMVTLTAAGEAQVHVVLRGGGKLEGRVLDERRNPLAGARVELAAVRGTLERSASCADDGSFAFASVPGEVSLSVSRPDSPDDVALHTTVVVREGEVRTIELVLPAAREAMTVRVKDEHGGPLPLAQILVVSLQSGAPLRRTLFSDRDGAAVFRDAVGLPIRVQATLRGHAPVVREVAVAPRDLALELAPGIVVTGRVTARGGREALTGAEVALHAASGILRARTDRDGAYKIDDVPPGRARLTVRATGKVPLEKAVAIERPARADRPIDLEPINLEEGGTVQGQVVDARGDPVRGARVAQGTVPVYLPADGPGGGVVSDQRGGFSLEDLPEGAVVIEAFDPERGRGRATVEVRAGRTTDRVTITLHPDAAAPPEEPAAGGVAATLAERAGAVVVQAVASGSEAERAGLETGDRLSRVDGQPVRGVAGAKAKLFGPLGEDVVVEVGRGPSVQTLRIPRERIRP